MGRIDYLDEPDAPRANALVVAVCAVVRDGAGRLLLIRRSDSGLWALPGGGQELGESVSQAVVREVAEETGMRVEVTGIAGVYSDPGHVIAYDDGEVRQEFSLCFHATPTGGRLRTSSESTEVAWIEPEEIDMLPVHPSMRLRLRHGLAGGAPYIG